MSRFIVIEEFCQSTHLSREALVEIVELGILAPAQDSDPWAFELESLLLARRAQRLKRELALDWAGTAVALRLFDEIEHLRRENQQLRQRVQRFEQH